MQIALPCPSVAGSPTRVSVLLAGALLLVACGGPDPRTAKRAEEVPANSEAETRRQNEEKLRAADAAEAAERDKPKYGRVPTSDGDGAATASSSPPAGGGATSGARDSGLAAKGGKPAPPAKNAVPGASGGKVSKADCGKLFDKYIDLEVASNPAFQGLGPELKGMIDSAKKQALAQKGDPCDSQEVSRAQYDCAINARSTDEWKRCLK